MEYFYDEGFSINHSIDIDPSIDLVSDICFFPQLSFLNCNRLVLSMLIGKDVSDDIQKGINMNGITDRGPPFFTPLQWCAFIYANDWKKEKSVLEKFLKQPIDCNYIGMCGFNLLHMYIAESLVWEHGFQKLQWWVQHPMVDVNTQCLYIGKRPDITMFHPSEFILFLGEKYPDKVEKVMGFLLSRGLSTKYIHTRLLDIKPLDLIQKQSKTEIDVFLVERLKNQWGACTDDELIGAFRNKSPRRIKEADYVETPTPQMNNLFQTPLKQHLIFCSPSSGIRFGFHSSYLDIIVKTHRFPFTSEELSNKDIDEWLSYVRRMWIPREEFVDSEIIDDFPIFLSKEGSLYRDFPFAVQLLCNWIISIYPYSRFMMLTSFPWSHDKIYSYLCKEMKNGSCYLQPFHNIEQEGRWVQSFFWGCYDSVREGFPFPNQVEELISRMEIFKNYSSFNTDYTNVRSFLQEHGMGENVFRIYAQEYDYSLVQVFYIFKRMSCHFNS